MLMYAPCANSDTAMIAAAVCVSDMHSDWERACWAGVDWEGMGR